jgi:hypothetical protein
VAEIPEPEPFCVDVLTRIHTTDAPLTDADYETLGDCTAQYVAGVECAARPDGERCALYKEWSGGK